MTTPVFGAAGLRLVGTAAAACALFAGCAPSDPVPGDSRPPTAAGGGSEGSGEAGEPGAGGGNGGSDPSGSKLTNIDACTLISADDIESLLGTPIEGVPTGVDSEGPGCVWENPDNAESVTLGIGYPDSAINGTLPPVEEGFPDPYTPGPDGMRFLGDGSVEFVADKRQNSLQIAVLSMLSDGTANDAAVELARKVISQIDG